VIAGERLVAFIIACVAIILAPGPSVMFVLARAIAWGRWVAWLTAAGNALGMLALAGVIAVGLGPLFQRSALLLEVVQVAGGVYLIYLGVDALRKRGTHAADMLQVEETRPTTWRILREGFLVGGLNPKALIFFSAVFPQFLDPGGSSVTMQMLLFGVIFSVLCLLLDGSWGLLVGSGRDWFATSPARLVVLRIVGGIVMILLGVLVLIPLALSHLSSTP
jgi:threonine/homoserine/homoserine lactone efflux protein